MHLFSQLIFFLNNQRDERETMFAKVCDNNDVLSFVGSFSKALWGKNFSECVRKNSKC